MTPRVATKHATQPQHAPAPAQPVDTPQVAASEPEAKTNGGSAPRELERVIQLEFPVEFAGQRYETITVRRLKTKDLRVLDVPNEQGQVSAGIAVTAIICGVDEAIIDELDISDYLKIQEVVSKFFPPELVASLQAGLSRSSQT